MDGLMPIDVKRIESARVNPSDPMYRLFCPDQVPRRRPTQPQRRSSQSGRDVYIFKKAHTLIYKIGVSKDPAKRLRQIGRGFDNTIYPVFSDYCCKPFELEARLHRELKKFNVGGEWFELNDDQVKSLIRQIKETP